MMVNELLMLLLIHVLAFFLVCFAEALDDDGDIYSRVMNENEAFILIFCDDSINGAIVMATLY